MSSTDAILKLQLLLDKTGSPYFTNDEYLNFLNMASLEVLNRLFPDTLGGIANLEIDQNTSQSVAPLIYTLNTTINSNGVIPYSTLDQTLRSLSSDLSSGVYRILSVAINVNGVYQPAKWKRFNELWKSNTNYFKTPSSSNIVYTIEQNSFGGRSLRFWQYAPIGFQSIVSVIKTPRIMTISNSPDFDDYVMNQVIQIAYQLATVATRDESGLQLGTNTTIQSK